MSLAPGARLGPYEILAPLGAGGMGEVWKARDTRLDRLVAVKVLPEHLISDAESLARFEREAKVVAGLSHPNITSLFDIGREGGSAYAVMELLEGESLRARLAHGPMPARKVIELGIQIAHGLAAAHGRGILHRDLKPDNLWITKEGRIKILDFGLAKVAHSPFAESHTDESTVALDSAPTTKAGVVLGTVGYMSPEQVRGQAVDPRSDLFGLGVVLWEMLAGQRPFKGDSAIETLHAILAQEPPTLPPGLELPPELVRILDHCLQKNPDARFQTARDLGFALENLSNPSASRLLLPGGPKPPSRWLRTAALGLAGLLAGGTLVHTLRPAPSVPLFHRITFEAGAVRNARFAKDGQTILYSAWWGGSQPGIYSTRVGSTEARSLDQPGAELLAISPRDQIALLQKPLNPAPGDVSGKGTLAIGQLAGGTPVPSERDILTADWTPDGSRLLVVRSDPDRSRLESPPGNILEQGEWTYLNPRFSPDGQSIAFLRMAPRTSEGEVALFDLKTGKARSLTKGIVSLGGLCWRPDGQEIWYSTFSDPGGNLRAVDLKGRVRVVAAVPDDIRIQDIAPDGRVLLTHGILRKSVLVQKGPSEPFHEIGKYKWCSLLTLATDGRQALTFEDPLDKDRPFYVFLHDLERMGTPPKPQPDSSWLTLSPDTGELLDSRPEKDETRVSIRPQDGRPDASFAGTDKRFFMPLAVLDDTVLTCEFQGSAAPRLMLRTFAGAHVRDLGDAPECVDQMYVRYLLSPDRSHLLCGAKGRGFRLVPLKGSGAPGPAPFLGKDDNPAQWSRDGKSLFLVSSGHPPLSIWRLDIATGQRTFLRSLDPPDTAQDDLGWVCLDRDARAAALEFQRSRTSLYLVEGLK